MTECVISIYVIIVIYPVFCSCVVRWICVYRIDFTLMRKIQHREGVVIVTLNKDIDWLRRVLVDYFFASDFFQHREGIFGFFLKLFFDFFFIPNQPVFFTGFKFLYYFYKLALFQF